MQKFSLPAFILFFIIGCTEQKESTTRGNLHISLPESIAPVMITEVNAFLNLYQRNGAFISSTIVSSEEAARRFVYDTAQIAFLTRQLTPLEKETIKKSSPDLTETIVAFDAIAVIVNENNRLFRLTTTQVQKIYHGTFTRWAQCTETHAPSDGIHVFYQDSSDITEYLTYRFGSPPETIVSYTRTTSDIETIHSVENDPLSIGFVSLSWLDSIRSAVKVVELGRTQEDLDTTFAPGENITDNFYSPHPAHIYRNYYPLKRAIYMYTRGQVDLAAGFGTFVATIEGQKIFMEHGILAGTQKIRLKSNE